ncbi:MAG: hypothetical protein ACI9OD_000754 [Limisphaerales bacterium]|jgi:hypothetical protein
MTRESILSDGFGIYIDTVFQGPVPVVSDGNGFAIIYRTELAAHREIASHAIVQLEEFLRNEREFEDAIIVEEYIVPVTVCGNGRMADSMGNTFRAAME